MACNTTLLLCVVLLFLGSVRVGDTEPTQNQSEGGSELSGVGADCLSWFQRGEEAFLHGKWMESLLLLKRFQAELSSHQESCRKLCYDEYTMPFRSLSVEDDEDEAESSLDGQAVPLYVLYSSRMIGNLEKSYLALRLYLKYNEKTPLLEKQMKQLQADLRRRYPRGNPALQQYSLSQDAEPDGDYMTPFQNGVSAFKARNWQKCIDDMERGLVTLQAEHASCNRRCVNLDIAASSSGVWDGYYVQVPLKYIQKCHYHLGNVYEAAVAAREFSALNSSNAEVLLAIHQYESDPRYSQQERRYARLQEVLSTPAVSDDDDVGTEADSSVESTSSAVDDNADGHGTSSTSSSSASTSTSPIGSTQRPADEIVPRVDGDPSNADPAGTADIESLPTESSREPPLATAEQSENVESQPAEEAAVVSDVSSTAVEPANDPVDRRLYVSRDSVSCTACKGCAMIEGMYVGADSVCSNDPINADIQIRSFVKYVQRFLEDRSSDKVVALRMCCPAMEKCRNAWNDASFGVLGGGSVLEGPYIKELVVATARGIPTLVFGTGISASNLTADALLDPKREVSWYEDMVYRKWYKMIQQSARGGVRGPLSKGVVEFHNAGLKQMVAGDAVIAADESPRPTGDAATDRVERWRELGLVPPTERSIPIVVSVPAAASGLSGAMRSQVWNLLMESICELVREGRNYIIVIHDDLRDVFRHAFDTDEMLSPAAKLWEQLRAAVPPKMHHKMQMLPATAISVESVRSLYSHVDVVISSDITALELSASVTTPFLLLGNQLDCLDFAMAMNMTSTIVPSTDMQYVSFFSRLNLALSSAPELARELELRIEESRAAHASDIETFARDIGLK